MPEVIEDDVTAIPTKIGDVLPAGRTDEIRMKRADFDKAAALYAERQNIGAALDDCKQFAKRHI